MSAAPVVRPMTADDLDAVHAIEVGAHSHPWGRGALEDSLAAGHDAQVLVDGDGTVLGYSVVMAGVDECHLLNLTVLRSCQRQGWGRQLLRRVVAQARTAGFGAVWLEVRASNAAALALYASEGFDRTGLRRAYYPARHGREDAVLMSRVLADAGREAA